MIEHVIVMATRPRGSLESLTRTRPKAMLPILGKPVIARVMNAYYQAGARRFTVVVGEQEGGVIEWLSRRWYPDARVEFAPQGHWRGTASALFAARSLIDGPFVVAPCDYLLPQEHVARLCHYFDTHPGDVAVLSLYHTPGQAEPAAGVLLDPRGYVIYVSERPVNGHQDFMTALPVYGFTPRVLDYLDRVPVMEDSGQRTLATALQMMIDDGGLVGALRAGWCIPLERPDDLMRANLHFLTEMKAPSLLSELPTSVEIIPPVRIDGGVVVGDGAKLGPNVYVESGSVIGPRALVRDALVLGGRVAAGQRVEGKIVSEETR